MTAAGAGGSARSAILKRIRSAVGKRTQTAAEEYGRIGRAYRQTATMDSQAMVALFVDRLLHYDVGVVRSEAGGLSDAVARTLSGRGKQSVVVPPGLPREWLPRSVAIVEDSGLSPADLDRAEGVLTACSIGIASTGTIVLRHTPAEGRRALTLVPDYHLCVVFEDQVVQTVPEAMRRLAEWQPALVTTISGPSATADIEMTRVRGVHGPRTLDVIVVS